MRERPAADGDGAVLYWSGGKDCALALHLLHTTERFQEVRVGSLLTTFTGVYDRVTNHGIRRELIEQQAAMLGIDLHKTYRHPGVIRGSVGSSFSVQVRTG